LDYLAIDMSDQKLYGISNSYRRVDSMNANWIAYTIWESTDKAIIITDAPAAEATDR